MRRDNKSGWGAEQVLPGLESRDVSLQSDHPRQRVGSAWSIRSRGWYWLHDLTKALLKKIPW